MFFILQSVVHSVVLCLSAVAGCSGLLSRVKSLAQRMVSVSTGELAEL